MDQPQPIERWSEERDRRTCTHRRGAAALQCDAMLEPSLQRSLTALTSSFWAMTTMAFLIVNREYALESKHTNVAYSVYICCSVSTVTSLFSPLSLSLCILLRPQHHCLRLLCPGRCKSFVSGVLRNQIVTHTQTCYSLALVTRTQMFALKPAGPCNRQPVEEGKPVFIWITPQ